MGETAGERFVEAFAAKEFERAGEHLDPDVDFRALTPNRFWEASGAQAVVSEVLPQWLEDSHQVEALSDVETSRVADRDHISFRIRGHDDDGPFVLEQQAYYTERDGRIDWLRLLCSGMRPD